MRCFVLKGRTPPGGAYAHKVPVTFSLKIETRIDRVRHRNYGNHKRFGGIALEEYQKDGDEKAFLSALSVAARVSGGFGKLSKKIQ